jgi:hypothetical protein
MDLTVTQRAILTSALEVEAEHGEVDFYFTACVYDRPRAGLRRVGAIAQDDEGRWQLTDEARAALDSS